MDDIATNLQGIRERIRAAAVVAGRDPAAVRLLAVSKTVPADGVRAAYAVGQRLFGENRVQELRDKAAALPPDCEWHLIGHLQSNKARQAIQAAAWIHSVDSVELIERLNRIAGEEGRRPVVLLELNLSGEATKFGATAAAARELLTAVVQSPQLECRGFMTMAPYEAPEGDLRRIFGGLRELRNQLAVEFGVPLPELSMGMSGDFEIAVREGATLVRVGTAIFGSRS